MSDFREMYFTHAAEYDAMIVCEDFQGNLFTALNTLLTDRVKAERWLVVPECTGIWWKVIE